MSTSSALRQRFSSFLEETEVHGVRHVVNAQLHPFRRFLWLVAFLASCWLFVWLAASRLRTFLSEPTRSKVTVYEEDFVVPRLYVCSRSCDILNPPQPPEVWAEITVPEAILYLVYRYSVRLGELVNLIEGSGNQEKVSLRSGDHDQPQFQSTCPRETNETMAFYRFLRAKLTAVVAGGESASLSWNYNSQLEKFLWKFVDTVKLPVKSCRVEIHPLRESCLDDLEKEVMLSEVYDLSDIFTCWWVGKNHTFVFGSQIAQPFDNRITLEMEAGEGEAYAVGLANPEQIPATHYKSLLFGDYIDTTSAYYTVTIQRRHIQRSYPSHCSSAVVTSRCIHECYLRSINCTFFLHNTFYPRGRETPFCRYNRTVVTETCIPSCPKQCDDTSFLLMTEKVKAEGEGSLHLTLDAPQLVLTEETSQELDYPWQEFASEVGGYLGLLLGASCLTIYQLLDFCAHLIFSFKGTKGGGEGSTN